MFNKFAEKGGVGCGEAELLSDYRLAMRLDRLKPR